MNLTGFAHWQHYLDDEMQGILIDHLKRIVTETPFFTPKMPNTGKPFSVQMTNCGDLGWVSDRENGYRYQAMHPITGRPWSPIPDFLLSLWQELTNYPLPPQACLVNAYSQTAKMGLHQDRDEQDLEAPVLSISLGATATFRLGGRKRTDPTKSLRLCSGDIVALSGKDRLAYHGVDRILKEETELCSVLSPGIKRINLTLRRVSKN